MCPCLDLFHSLIIRGQISVAKQQKPENTKISFHGLLLKVFLAKVVAYNGGS